MPKKKVLPEKKDPLDIIKSTADELLADLDIKTSTEAFQDADVYTVKILPEDESDTPLLIGYHGETVASIQVILGLLVFKKLDEWVRVTVDVADYREKRAEQFKIMAESFAAQALSTNQAVYLPPLSPNERRLIHIALAERTDVETFSEGEGRNRRLVIKPKESKPS